MGLFPTTHTITHYTKEIFIDPVLLIYPPDRAEY